MTRNQDGRTPPKLEAIPGGKSNSHGTVPDPVADDDEIRAAKVAEARIKILNGYYARGDVQKQLAERLIYALGS